MDEPRDKPRRSDLARGGSSPAKGANAFAPTFLYAYGTSVMVAFMVAFIWLTVIHGIIPGVGQETPDVAKLSTLFAATIPSIFTCLFFSACYRLIVKRKEDARVWPAFLFGLFSGLVFNLMTLITLIEYFFDW